MPSAATPTNPSSRFATVVLASLALAAGYGATRVIDSVQYERLEGSIAARRTTVVSGRLATITKFLVTEGSTVTLGQPLVELHDHGLAARVEIAERQLYRLQVELAATEARKAIELTAQERVLNTELFDAELKLTEFQQQKFNSQVENVAWQQLARNPDKTLEEAFQTDNAEPLILPSLVSENVRQEELRVRAVLRQGAAQNAQEVLSVRIELCEQRRRKVQQELLELPNRLEKSLGIEALKAQVTEAQTCLETLKQQPQDFTLTATEAGRVASIRRNVGDTVRTQDTIIQTVDEARPLVQLPLESRNLPDFAKGVALEVRFPDGSLRKARVGEIALMASATGTLTVPVEPAGAVWPRMPDGAAVEVRRRR